jgi:hypothetical protein
VLLIVTSRHPQSNSTGLARMDARCGPGLVIRTAGALRPIACVYHILAPGVGQDLVESWHVGRSEWSG